MKEEKDDAMDVDEKPQDDDSAVLTGTAALIQSALHQFHDALDPLSLNK